MANSKKIDAIDAKILKMLLLESRTSFTEMAKRCKISVGAVRMRYNRLKKAGIIASEYLHINPKFWGYKYTVDVRINTFVKDEEEVLKMLNRNPNVILAGSFGYIIMGLIVLPNLDQLRSIVEEIAASPKVRHVETLIWAESQDIFHPENLIIKPYTDPAEDRTKFKMKTNKPKEVSIDETDKQILRKLANNSRRSFRSIAEELGISTSNVIKRYRKLRKGRVFIRSAITVDLKKLGYVAWSINFLKLSPKGKISKIREQLLQLPNLLLLIEHVGSYDLRIDFPIAAVEDLFQITEQIRKIDDVEYVDSRMMRIFPFPTPLYNKLLTD